MHIGPYIQVTIDREAIEEAVVIIRDTRAFPLDPGEVLLTSSEARQLRTALGVLLRSDDLIGA